VFKKVSPDLLDCNSVWRLRVKSKACTLMFSKSEIVNAIIQVEDSSISVPNIDVFRPEVAMSCEDAIRYLSQLQSKVQISNDFMSDLHLGAGGGGSKRIRAVEFIEDRQVECKEKFTVLKRKSK
jgi:hypothetical protein